MLHQAADHPLGLVEPRGGRLDRTERGQASVQGGVLRHAESDQGVSRRSELEKLLTARPGLKRLEPADLEVIVAFREEREIGKLLRAIGERKCSEALQTLRELLASKVAETLILWCIADLFRQALRGVASYGYRGGWSRGANPYSTPQIVPLAQKNYPREELLQAMRAVRRADLGIKSSWKDSKILLEFLVWQIVVGKAPSGEAALGDEVPVPSAES